MNINLDETEAAKRIGVSKALMRKWRLYGAGPVYMKLGRLVRYSQEDLNDFLTVNRVMPTGGQGNG